MCGWIGVGSRWRPPGRSTRRAALGIALNVGWAAAAIVLFALAPRASGGDPLLVATLVALSGCAFLAEARLKTQARPGFSQAGTFFNAGVSLALVTLFLAGPLCALLVWWVPDAISRIALRREPIASPGHVATVSGYALAVLAGQLLLEQGGSLALLLATGIAMYSVNFAVTSLAFDPFFGDQRPKALIRSEFLEVLPALLPMLALAAMTAALVPDLGVPALVPLALALVLPQLVLAGLANARSVAELSPERATAVYAAAIADVMRLPRRERAALARAAEIRLTDDAADLESLASHLGIWIRELGPGTVNDLEQVEARLIARRARDRFDGGDWPRGVALLDAAPRTSRTLAVARAWADRTAAGTAQLSHADAVGHLRERAGGEFDPDVVAAAARVVSEEQAFLRTVDAEPRLHRLPLPPGLRRTLAPAMLRRGAAT